MQIILIMLAVYLALIIFLIVIYYRKVHRPVKKEQNGKGSADFKNDVRIF